LNRGDTLSLTQEDSGLTDVLVGLGWNIGTSDNGHFDLDASALMVDASRKVPNDQYFVFYNNTASPDGSVVHMGDNRTGMGDDDDEVIHVRLGEVPAGIDTIVFSVTAFQPSQTFGQVRNSYIRIVNRVNGKELVRYDLGDDFSSETALVFGELYRTGVGWSFRAVGQGHTSGLPGIAKEFGVRI